MEHYRTSKLLNDSTILKFLTKKNGSKQMICQEINIPSTKI